MKNALSISVIALTVAWSASVFALEDYEANVLQLEKTPAKDFKKVWFETGRYLGYPKFSSSDSANGEPTFAREYGDDSWFNSEFPAWEKYENKKKFYMAGLVIQMKFKNLAPDVFKTETLSLYQCSNALHNFQIFLRTNGIRITGTVGDNLKQCLMGKL